MKIINRVNQLDSTRAKYWYPISSLLNVSEIIKKHPEYEPVLMHNEKTQSSVLFLLTPKYHEITVK